MLVWRDVISICIFGGVAASVYVALALLDPYWLRVRNRVRELQPDGRTEYVGNSASDTPAIEGWSAVFRNAITPDSADSLLLKRLTRAGVYDPLAPSRFMTARLFCTAVPPALVLSIALLLDVNMNAALLGGCLLGGMGSLAPGFFLDRNAARRQIKLRQAFPDFLDLMVVCQEGGLSLQETVRRVSTELRVAHPALAVELNIVQRDIELGATIDQALKRFAQRADFESARTLSTFMRETQRFGTNITEALRSHADGLRSQREQSAEEAAQKAAVKILLPTILLIFPAVFVVLVGPAAVQIYTAFGQK